LRCNQQQARRRLSRQFRRHKLEPQQQQQPSAVAGAAAAGSSSAARLAARLRAHALLPRPRPRHQQQDAYAYDDQQTAAAARELLEWQFQLGPQQASSEFALDQPPEWPGDADADAGELGALDAAAMQGASALLEGLSSGPAADPGKQLTKAIMHAQHWRQVQSLIQEHGPDCLNARHLCAALTRLVHLQHSFAASGQQQQLQSQQGVASVAAGPAAAFVQHLYASVAGELQSLEYRQACNVVWAASKLQQVAAPDAAWVSAVYQHAAHAYGCEKRQQHEQQEALPELQQQAQQLEQHVYDMRHAAQLSYALVSLQQHLPQAQVQEYVGWVVSNTRQILQQHIQQHQPAEAGQRQQRPLKHQQQLGARDLATVAWSLASLCAEPSPAWLSAFAAALSCRGLVSAGNYRDLSQLLWSLATFSKHAAEGSAAANSIHTAASAVLAAAQETHLASCDGQALANTLWALATLGQRPPLSYLKRLLLHAEAAASRGFLNPQGIAMSLWGLAALGVVPQASCMAALQAAAQQQLPAMTPQGLSSTLWALAVLERPPSKAWLAAFWPACRALLPHMTSQGLVSCLWASARLRLQPPQEWLGDVAALMLRDEGLSSLTGQGLSNVIWAMSRISISCRAGYQLLSASLQQAVQRLEQQQSQQQQQQQQQHGGGADDAPAAVLNIFELSGLMYAVCQLQQRQRQQCGASSAALLDSNSSSAGGDAAASSSGFDMSAAVLMQLTQLLQHATLPLLPTAAPSELAILLWSQVTMPAPAAAAAGAAALGAGNALQHQPSGPAPAAASAVLHIPKAWLDAWYDGSSSAINAASSRDLSNWLWCLAQRGLKPPSDWLASWQVASFRQMGRASSQVSWRRVCAAVSFHPRPLHVVLN
jgi:hypothetical protein